MTTPPTPAGWFPDPEGSGGQRYWDGSAWTEPRSPGTVPETVELHGEPMSPGVELPLSFTQTGDVADTLYADVSEWQVGVNDSYPYPVLCIRSNDGTHRDRRWVNNYDWCLRNADSGRLTFFIVYFVWRPNWQQTVDTFKDQVRTPHPKMAVMLDVESWGGQIRGDRSAGINAAYEAVGAFVGSTAKVIGYGNVGDLNNVWPHKPPGIRLVIAAYGHNPPYPGKVAHQYTDGSGYGRGLPEGAPPFGRCDMNSADGLTAEEFARACGIVATESVRSQLSNSRTRRRSRFE